MKVQEVKPEGRRLIGELSLRAAHNVHKVDVCAYNLSSKTNCMIAVFAKCIPKKDSIIYNKDEHILRSHLYVATQSYGSKTVARLQAAFGF